MTTGLDGDDPAFPWQQPDDHGIPGASFAGISLRAYIATHLDVPYDEVVNRIKADYSSYNNTRYPSLREIAVQRAAMRILEADALIRLLDGGQA